MTTRFISRATAVLLSLTLAVAPAFGQVQKPLEEKDNPLLIGKRDINKHQVNFYSLDKEIAIGRQLAAEVERSAQFVTDPIVTEYVNRVAQNIVLHSDARVPFTIKVIDSNEINAFALPGGFLFVNRGLVEAAESEAELAGVIAHEVAHVAARHGVEQASKGELVNWLSIPLIFLGGWGGYIARQAAGLAIPLGFLKFSRGAEKEADRLAAQYMWATGYDPNALITFFEKLQAKNKKKPGTLAKVFSTHPLTDDRIKEVRALLARFPEKTEYGISSSEFNEVKNRLSAISVNSRAVNASHQRPTLKRRSPEATEESGSESETPGRPTLKRRPELESGTTETESSSASERPTLKRRPESNN